MLAIRLGDKQDLAWAQEVVTQRHYLHRKVDWRARPMVYIVGNEWARLGLVMAGIPHATRCRGWWGYPGLPTQWQVVDLCRIWLDPRIQTGGEYCSPSHVPGFFDRHNIWRSAVATWAMGKVMIAPPKERGTQERRRYAGKDCKENAGLRHSASPFKQ